MFDTKMKEMGTTSLNETWSRNGGETSKTGCAGLPRHYSDPMADLCLGDTGGSAVGVCRVD